MSVSSGCKPDCVEPEPEIYKIAPSEMTFDRNGGSQVLSVQTTAEIETKSDASWCTVTKERSQSAKMAKFTVTAVANDDITERKASLSVYIGDDVVETVPIIQHGHPLIVHQSEVVLGYEAEDFDIILSSSEDYKVETADSWIKLVSAEKESAKFSAEANKLPYERKTTIAFKTSKASHTVNVTQTAYSGKTPEPDKTGMESDAKTLMKKMVMGLNLGNTLEAIGGETAWGAPRTTEEMIRYFKELGFNAVRIPCSWDQNLEDGEGYIVKETWMRRVVEVVDYVVNNDMYAILNIHWDGGWLENDIPNGYNKAVDEQQMAIWTQIATVFRDYDEHLLFAGTNEPNAKNAGEMETLLKYEQTFVDAVRATGGKNAYRVLVIQGPSTDIDMTVDLMDRMPSDKVEGRLAAEVHYYTPPQFCILSEDADWGKCEYFWGMENKDYAVGAYAGRWSSWGAEEHLAKQMAKMKKKFWDNGIPVIIGEFGASSGKKFDLSKDEEENARAKEGYDKSHAAFSSCVVKEAKTNGCVPFYWHCEGDVIDRSELRVTQPLTYEAMLEASATQYPE